MYGQDLAPESSCPPNDALALAPLIAEYERLKVEQLARIGVRDNLLYFTLGASAAGGGFALRYEPTAWFFIPMVGLVLGWTYLANDTKITELGRYVKLELSPRIGRITKQPDVFGWESSSFKVKRRLRRKVLQWLVDLVAFVVPGISAPAAYYLNGGTPNAGAVVATFATLLGIGRLAWEMTLESDIKSWCNVHVKQRRRRQDAPPEPGARRANTPSRDKTVDASAPDEGPR